MELPQPWVIETGDFQNLWIEFGLIMVLGRKGSYMTKERDEQCFFFGFSNNLSGVFGN